LILFGILLLFLLSCNPTKYVKPDELFLQKNKLKIDSRKIDKDDLENIIKQKTNRKILGLFRVHLGAYNLFNKKTGEMPVIYDSLLTEKTVKQLNLYVNNRGYFNNKVTYITKQNKNRINVEYKITAGKPYIIKKVNYKIEDKEIIDRAIYILGKTMVRPGNNFDIDVLDLERERIKKEMKNEGYYYFNKEFIKYKVDSTIGNNEVDIYLYINNQIINDELNDTVYSKEHSKYYINDIKLHIQDTITEDTIRYKELDIIYNNKLKYRPRMLNHALSLRKSNLYYLDDQQSTYRHLSELKLFKNVNITFEDIGNNKLNTNIYLTPTKIKSFSIESIGTNSAGNLGIEGNLIYQNKNLFRGGEHLTVKLNGGLEIQQLINEEQEEINFLGLPFNTIEFGPEINLEFPRFLLPVNLEKFSKRANPKTNLNLLFNLQKRPEYVRNLTQITFGYFWKETRFKKHFINPINISVINLEPTIAFQEKLKNENNPFILNSFQNHFINSTTYSFIYNNQRINKITNFTFFKFNAEFAGNIQSAYNNLTNKPYDNPDTESYNLFNIRYAQFVKTDFDLRHYNQSKTTSFVKRINVGIGKPYGNLNVLPFEKSYYGGGANSIRAWQARSLGPGSLSDSLTENSLNQIGELKIEGNVEYRFDITKLFEGAAFIDAGNIWILSEDEDRPNAEFKSDKFWKDIAIGVGIGLRLDFNFFLIRFDLAAKLKDPAGLNPEKLELIWNAPTLNLGIGYPF
jgi:outer membrane protein assembly factor BamA